MQAKIGSRSRFKLADVCNNSMNSLKAIDYGSPILLTALDLRATLFAGLIDRELVLCEGSLCSSVIYAFECISSENPFDLAAVFLPKKC
jgi:hypothetical protein